MKTKNPIRVAALALVAAISGRVSAMSVFPAQLLNNSSWTVVGPVLLESYDAAPIQASFEVKCVDTCVYYRIRHNGRCHLVSKCSSDSMACEKFVCQMPQGRFFFYINGI